MRAAEQQAESPRRSAAWMAVCVIIFVVGVAVWIGYAAAWDPPRAWRALLINFIYFTPLAAGMVAWPAVVMVSRGRWAGRTIRPALAAAAFAPISLAAFAVLWFGRDQWAVWLKEPDLHNAAWLSEGFLFGRDAAMLILLWIMAAWFARRAGAGRPVRFAAGFVFAYAVVFSFIAFDLVMALDPHWYSALFGIYYFISAMYAAVAAWTLAALIHGPRPDIGQRQDLGKLIVAFSLLTTYMMFSQLMVIWYENLPEEVRFVIPRLALSPWRWVSAGLLAVIYLGPLVFLLTVWSKRSPWYLGIAAAAVLAGLWLERWWLVTPTLGGPMTLGLVELSITAAFTAALVASILWLAPRLPGAAVEGVEST